jgi:CheY-like chemotaxis protein
MKLTGNFTILLAEDVEDDVFFMRRALRQANISNPLQVASDGQVAIDYLSGQGQYADRSQYPMPSLVFLDLKMPHKNGFEVLEWIRQQPELETLTVIVLTSSSEELDIHQTYRLGARSFLIKPPTPEMLVDLLDSLKNYWLKHNEFAATARC